MAVRASAEKFLGRDTAPEDFVVSRAEGSFVFDDRGRRYIDFIMGWCVGNLGWNNATVNKAVRSARAPTYIYPYYSYKEWGQLAELLARIAPGRVNEMRAGVNMACCYGCASRLRTSLRSSAM